MLTQYTYIKPRCQFGKQCVFRTDHVAEENIQPEPKLMQDYVYRPYTHRQVQLSKQYAAHEVQTMRKIEINTGVHHTEGGWPKEVNARDAEVVQRFRRRVEKDDNWAINMRSLLSTMEDYVLQNNAINIYQNFFDDLIVTPMIKDHNIRVVNLYEDPETKVRPIKDISWSPNYSDRLAVAYGFPESEQPSADLSPYSYVWDLENPNKALYTLKSPFHLTTVKFNPRDPVMLVSGLVSGQVCYWDIRSNEKPMETSHPYSSHRYPVTQTLWIPSKVNTDFFSCSTDGTILWWDARFMKKPTETLVMDLEQPQRADIYKAVGITALQFEQTMSSKFLAGTEDGMVVNVNRRTSNLVEKLAIRFHCYTGPVIAIDRNPIYTKNFLTIGNWSANIWADDTKEGNLLCTRYDRRHGGCWSKARCSVFFTINKEGLLEAYDILAGIKTPLTNIHVCNDSLTAISSHEEDGFLAVGSSNGNVYLLECTEDLATFTKEDKAALSSYLERCSRYEKAIDSRLKEIRLGHRVSKGVSIHESKVKSKKKEKDRKKEKTSMEKERLEDRKKSRASKPKGKSSVRMTYPEHNKAQMEYFDKIKQISARYMELDEADVQAAQEILKERIVTKYMEMEVESEKEDVKKQRSIKRFKSRIRTARSIPKIGEKEEEEDIVDVDLDSIRIKDKKQRVKKILRNSCAKQVCKPEICCADMEEKRRSKRRKKTVEVVEESPEKSRSFIIDNKWFRRLTDYIVQIPQPSRAFKRKILALKNTPPNVLRKELVEAKKEIRAWQETAIARKLASWAIERKLEKEPKKLPEIKLETMEERQEEAEEHLIKTDESVVEFGKKNDTKIHPKKSLRKFKKLRLTEEEIEIEKKEKQMELWNLLKQKVQEYDEQHSRKVFYPRISTAFVRMYSEETLDEESGNRKY
ncbi:dynein intermediate chain 3, ciliary-like [Bombus flavifrons]|uniref:dynein intermediate chain 3, ciliary-like n=1 Tax=Bombus flavifrons TaxID=103934 RepID=UPI0037041AE2